MAKLRIVVTGATGFIGSHLVQSLHHDHSIFALSRGAPTLRGVAFPAGVRWFPVDISVARDVSEIFAAIGSADIVVHLAGYYDFTGERSPEYERINVLGMRNVLDAARGIGVRDFVFASSVAACSFPAEGLSLTENSFPDGGTPYAESKRAGEMMLKEYRNDFRCWNVRFAALFSDWCEYEPLFRFIETWLSRPPRSRVLAGRGMSAVPYLHIRDAVDLVRALLARREELDSNEIYVASPDGATSHLELFETATAAQFGQRTNPLFVPRSVCRAALHLRDMLGRSTGNHSFERSWMGRMIDLRLDVDSNQTRKRLGWAPRARLGILRRMPFVIQNRKAFPSEWHRRNQGRLRRVRRHDNLHLHRVLQGKTEWIAESLASYLLDPVRAERLPSLRALGPEQRRVDDRLLLDALGEAVRTGEKSVFQRACRELTRRRRRDGLAAEEIVSCLNALSDLSVLALSGEDSGVGWSLALYDHITMTVQFGVDEAYDVFEEGR